MALPLWEGLTALLTALLLGTTFAHVLEIPAGAILSTLADTVRDLAPHPLRPSRPRTGRASGAAARRVVANGRLSRW
jgi:hypothetical protein